MIRVAALSVLLFSAGALAQSETLVPDDPDIVWSGHAGPEAIAETERWASDGRLEGNEIYSADMAFSRTGRLTSELDIRRLPGFGPIGPGTPVYARFMFNSRERRSSVIWCVPAYGQIEDFIAQPGACLFPAGDDRVAAYRMDTAAQPLTLHSRGSSRYRRDRPGIVEEAVDFGILWRESVRFEAFSDDRLTMEVVRETDAVTQTVSRQSIPLDAQGRGIARHSGGAWRLAPVEEGVEVELLSEPVSRAQHDAAIRDYVDFMRYRTGSNAWIANRPGQIAIADMIHDGFTPGETEPADGMALRTVALPPPLGEPVPAEPRVAYSTSRGHVLLEITEQVPAAINGVFERGDVVAIHALRARHAITIDSALEGINRDFEAGAVFGLLALGAEHNLAQPPENPQQRAWCDMRAIGRFTTGNLDCFIDSDGDGALDVAVMGDPFDTGVGVTLGVMRQRRDIDPHPYRAADPADHPAGELGYRICDGDNRTAPLRFAPVYRGDGAERWPDSTASACTLGVWPDAEDPHLVAIGDLTLRAVPVEDGYEITLVERLAAEPVYVAQSGTAPTPIRSLGSRREEAEERAEELSVSPLIALTEPAISTGRLSDQAAFASVSVKHTITGRLLNQMSQQSGWVRDDPLPVGTPVYGIPMGRGITGVGPALSQIIWCAPRAEEEGWDTVCWPANGPTVYWHEPSRNFFNTSLRFSSDSARASQPDVERTEVDFGFDLRLEVFLLEWDRDDADIRVRVCAGTDCDIVRGLAATRAEDGSVEFDAFGNHLRLTQPEDGDRQSLEVELIRAAPAGYTVIGSPNLLGEALRGQRD